MTTEQTNQPRTIIRSIVFPLARLAAALAAGLLLAAAVHAQAFPTKPVHLIVPNAPIRAEIEKWAKVVEAAGIKND